MSDDPHDTIEIHMSEYEALQRDSRRVRCMRELLDEFYMRRKLIRVNIIDGPRQIHSLRRVMVNRFSAILSKGWDG